MWILRGGASDEFSFAYSDVLLGIPKWRAPMEAGPIRSIGKSDSVFALKGLAMECKR